MLKSYASIVITAIISSGCSVMHFTQEFPDIVERDEPQEEVWHHTALHGTVEISRPVNLYKRCKGNNWARATVEIDFDNVLILGLTDGVIDYLVPPLQFVNFYAPWDVEIQCIK